MGQCGVAETRWLIILTGCLLGNGVLFSGTVNQLSAPFVVKISHFSSTLWCGSSVVVFVIYSIVVCVQDNKGHHVIHSPHTDDTRRNAAATAAAGTAAESAASVNRWLYRSCCVVHTAAKTSLRYVPKCLDGKKLMKFTNNSRKKKCRVVNARTMHKRRRRWLVWWESERTNSRIKRQCWVYKIAKLNVCV